MRSLARRFVGAVLGVALASSLSAASASAENWLENYYRQPAPERFESAVFALSREGYFEKPGQVPLALGFLAEVMARHPAQAEAWLHFARRALPPAHQRIVAAAAWYAGSPAGAAWLQEQARRSDPATRAELTRLLAQPAGLNAVPVQSRASLAFQWGRFLASGEADAVRTILAALGRDEQAAFGQDLRWSLAQQAARHDRVLAICRDELARHPERASDALRAVVREAEQQKPDSSS